MGDSGVFTRQKMTVLTTYSCLQDCLPSRHHLTTSNGTSYFGEFELVSSVLILNIGYPLTARRS